MSARAFSRQLEPRERKFCSGLTGTLLDEGSGVHDVLQNFARSLKTFADRFLEQRRLHSLLRGGNSRPLAVKESIRANQPLDYTLMLTSSRLRSASQWQLYDPDLRVTNHEMGEAPPSELDLGQSVSSYVNRRLTSKL